MRASRAVWLLCVTARLCPRTLEAATGTALGRGRVSLQPMDPQAKECSPHLRQFIPSEDKKAGAEKVSAAPVLGPFSHRMTSHLDKRGQMTK